MEGKDIVPTPTYPHTHSALGRSSRGTEGDGKCRTEKVSGEGIGHSGRTNQSGGQQRLKTWEGEPGGRQGARREWRESERRNEEEGKKEWNYLSRTGKPEG